MVEEPRCPYCVLIDHFMLLRPSGDGRFECMKCGHVAIPEDKPFPVSVLSLQRNEGI